MRATRKRQLLASLDAAFPFRGPCAFCGDPDARHRLFDALMERYRAGDSLESLAKDYGVSRDAVEVVMRLALKPAFPVQWVGRSATTAKA